MDNLHSSPPATAENKNILPDVVHSQHVAATESAVAVETETTNLDTGQNERGDASSRDAENISVTESISEHIPSKFEYSVTDSENIKPHDSLELSNVEANQENLTKDCPPNIPYLLSPLSDNPTEGPSKQSTSWPLDVDAVSDSNLLSKESPVNLALSSDQSKETEIQETKSKSHSPTPQSSEQESPKESPRSDLYLDSLNEESSQKSNLSNEDEDDVDKSIHSSEKGGESPNKSSGSEEIIKLDIRGSARPKIPFQASKIFFGPPPEGSTVIGGNIEPIPVFQTLLSPLLVAGDSMKVEEIFGDQQLSKEPSPSRSPELAQSKEGSPTISADLSPDKSLISEKAEQDVLVEEVIIDDSKERESDRPDDASIPTQPKSMAREDTMSFSTLTTDYKTICEEYHEKLEHLEDAITRRDALIEELTVSLQRSVQERDNLTHENAHLTDEVQNLQHIVAEHSTSDHDTVKGHLSDFLKYESMIRDDSTKFYSALMSGGSSVHSSNGEKDNDREEITVNYSRSDLKSSDSSEDFQTGFENKLATIISKFDEYIEENLRNKLRESIIQVLCTEIGKMRLDSDTEIRELESQMQQDKQTHTVETRRLRELLENVKAGNADINALREELSIKHEKEMENLRTYFEKKCSDMERSYSEEVWRGRCASSLSGSSLEGDAGGDAAGAGGDRARRRTRSADLPSLTTEQTQAEQSLKQSFKKYEQQIEELKAEHIANVNKIHARYEERIAALEEQIAQLKAHIQTSENTEGNVSVYQQDIDLELEKEKEEIFEKRLEQVRQEVVQQLQEQIQVLLSDPDAEVASWPLELVALREKIHLHHERELSSLRDELSAGEADKWKQRRNVSFDQNRQLEEVTKERDGLKRVAATLQRVVGQLVAYCACAEDELNRTVLAQLLGAHDQTSLLELDSRPATPNLSVELNVSSEPLEKHVHFAPDLNSILTELDEEGVAGFLQKQRDLGADIKKELEHSLRRLRQEARSLLSLSSKLAADRAKHDESKMLEAPSNVEITELVESLDSKFKRCNNCELHRKNMEEAMTECLQRENLLRSDLEAAMMKIAQLMTSGDRSSMDHLIAEGYGTSQPALPPLPRLRPRPLSESGALSLDGCASPRAHITRMAHDIDALQRERDDLQQQLEAANRQLRSTRQFVEEQATEREAERDEFAKRLAELRDENGRLATRLQNNARILNEVEQLEAQTREMNQIIAELESRKTATDEELKSHEEKIAILRDIIANLESQLEQKTANETEVLEQLAQMKKAIEDRDSKMRSLLGELESLRSEKLEQSGAMCSKCALEEDRYTELLEKVKEQCRWLEEKLHRRTQRLERTHEVCSAPCSEPSEDVSIRDQRGADIELKSADGSPSPRAERLAELRGVWDGVEALARAEDAALKRILDLEMQRNQLKDIAQEVRAERDVLQARMSEQALKISSLSARLQQQRNDAEALAHQAASELSVRLHDALAEVQRLKEDIESKDKQLSRAKQTLEDKDKLSDQHQSLYGNSCNPKDKVIILERELSNAQTRIAQLEALARSLEDEREGLRAAVRGLERALAEREDQLQELMALKLNEENENQKDDRSEVLEGAKTSARTLSDIVSISEYDEQDLQMRKAELKGHNVSLSGAPYDTKDKTLNRTLPPEVHKPNMSSLNIDFSDHFDLTSYSPRADSLPAHLTSTQNKDLLKQYKRNINETTVFGSANKFGEDVKHSTAQKMPDNCSMYPNRDVNASKNLTVEPKKINFSLEPSQDNKTQNDQEFTSLRELGITLDIRQENFPDILSQLKHEIKKSRTELQDCKSELKNAEEQLCEFPALKEEVEELKGLLENTMATMENDKKFYENQLDNFTSNKKLLEQRVSELTQEVADKSKDLHLLKEDILRRENMILELAKEKRNLTNKMAELELKTDELQSRNKILEKYETENHQMREKLSELHKLQQMVSEKNQQIDSLNQHLDRFDDLQRCLNDKTEEFENLKEAFEEKSNELFQMQDTVEALTKDVAKVTQENEQLNSVNKDLKLNLTKLEKDQENASLKLQNNESELERVNSLNTELASKIDELKLLTEKLKDKETEIEILNEDINSYHEEIASLKEQLKMVSRSPSPRNKSGEEKKTSDRQASNDKKQLVKIRKQISLLQHELDFNKKELNDKAFELAKAKLDITELTNNLSQANKVASDKEYENAELSRQLADARVEAQHLAEEKQRIGEQLEIVVARLREESDLSEIKKKLREKSQRCREFEEEVQELRDAIERLQETPGRDLQPADDKALVVSGTRSPTAELERALRDQLNYSHTLDEDILEQILSASSDEREDIPRLALNTSKSSSSIHSSSSERIGRLRAEVDRLQSQVGTLESRLRDKDALITELNRVRDKLAAEWQTAQLQLQTERDNAGRLQVLLDTHKDTASSLQNQDSNMIQILKKRLESCMQSELELQQREQEQRARIAHLERALLHGGDGRLQCELDNSERLKGEISLLKSKLDMERTRYVELQAMLDHVKLQAQADIATKAELCNSLRSELAELKRLKHESGVELLRAKELLSIQTDTIAQLEKKLNATKQKPFNDAMTEIESHKSELARELATLKQCLTQSHSPELRALRAEKQQLQARVDQLQARVEQLQQSAGGGEDKEQALRYLHGRCLRLESCRKALVWQKRYLQRVVSGYHELERTLRLPASVAPSRGMKRFKCAATVVVVVLRMGFLVRRRQHVRALSANCILRVRLNNASDTPNTAYPGTPPPAREPAARAAAGSLARRVFQLNLGSPSSPNMGDFVRQSPYATTSPREEPFLLSSPRGDVATAYLNKLELVSRCLGQAADAARDVP